MVVLLTNNRWRNFGKKYFWGTGMSRIFWARAEAELLQVGILFGTQFPSLGIFINKKVGF